MVLRYKHKNLQWIDLECPSHDEIHEVMGMFGIHPLVGQELVGPTLRPKVEVHPNFIYLILHFPTVRRGTHGRRIVESQEIDFIVGKNFIVTSRYDAIDPLHQFSKLFEVNSILDRSDMGEHAGFIFFYMMRTLYESLLHELESIGDSIHTIEEQIFNGKERAMVVRLSEVGRELLDVRRAVSLHREVLESFEVAGKRFFGEEFSYHLRSILGEQYKVWNSVSSHLDSIAELRETNNSLLNTRETETIKMLTILAFLTSPATLITNIFQIGVHTPIIGGPNDWLIVMGMITALTIALVAWAKMKKWF